MLRKYSQYLTKGQVSDMHDDLFQDTMLNAYLNKRLFKEGSHLKAWVKTIMKNTFFNMMEFKKVRVSHLDNLTYIAMKSSVEYVTDYVFVKEALDKAMTNLTPLERSVYDLRTFSGLPFKEISKELGMSDSTPRVHYRNSSIKLRKELEEYQV
jgi:RNA polymerase sigma-70 factor, ECF subfamily